MDLKKIVTLVVVFSLFLLASGSVALANSDEETSKSLTGEEYELEFDLESKETQEIKHINSEGEEVIIGIEPIPNNLSDSDESITPLNSTVPISSGTNNYRIYWTTGAANMEYYISVNRSGTTSRITDCWGLSVLLIGYSEDNREFTCQSTRAEYTASALMLGQGWITLPLRLTARISGTNILIDARA